MRQTFGVPLADRFRRAAATFATTMREACQIFAAIAAVCFVLWGLAAVSGAFLFPMRRLDLSMDREPRNLSEKALQSGAFWVLSKLGNTPSSRAEFFDGARLDVYVAQPAFENVPFPDRKAHVSSAAEEWCAATKGMSSIWFPSVNVKDIRTGRMLASYSCTFKRASIQN